MNRKKKVSEEEMKYTNTNDIADNKENNELDQDNYSGGKKSVNEEETRLVDNAASVTSGNEPGGASDKDAINEVSAEEKLAEMQDRYIRLSAEFDNYRKRTLREKMELTKHAGENILQNIVPVMDDFERALKLMETSTDCAGMKSGIDLIYSKFNDFLKQHGIREIESLNKDFDVDHHEAITKVAVQDESMKGKVVEVIVKGYWLHDKVLRFSKVVVGE